MRARSGALTVGLAALLAACGTPYMARTGPFPPCDTAADPFDPARPSGVCLDQYDSYRAFLFRLGYHERGRAAREGSSRSLLYTWERTYADTTDELLVEFVTSYEGAAAGGGTGPNVLRVHVTGRTSVVRDGERRRVRYSSQLPRDAEALVEHLGRTFAEVRERDDPFTLE
jgi:hypothetical protein